MKINNKLENLQLMRTLCMYIGPIFLILSVLCGLGWNHFGEKIKAEEARIAKESKAKESTAREPNKTVPVINVAGDYINGDKNINNQKEGKKMSEIENKKEDKKIINSGNLSIGQSGGVVNQTTNIINPKPEERHLNAEDANDLSKISKETIIELMIVQTNDECEKYGMEINKYLIGQGYNVEITLIGFTPRFPGNNRFYMRQKNEQNRIQIFVQEFK